MRGLLCDRCAPLSQGLAVAAVLVTLTAVAPSVLGAEVQWPRFGTAHIVAPFKDDHATSVIVKSATGRETEIVTAEATSDDKPAREQRGDEPATADAPVMPRTLNGDGAGAAPQNDAASQFAGDTAARVTDAPADAATAGNTVATPASDGASSAAKSFDAIQVDTPAALGADAAKSISEPAEAAKAASATSDTAKVDTSVKSGFEPTDATKASSAASEAIKADTAESSASKTDAVAPAAAPSSESAKVEAEKSNAVVSEKAPADAVQSATSPAAATAKSETKVEVEARGTADAAANNGSGPVSVRGMAPAKKASSPPSPLVSEISHPKPVYYDKRASEILKADAPREVKDGLETSFPEHSMVSCVAGCDRGKAEVVFISRNSEMISATTGEVVPTSTDGSAPVPDNAITCVAGCYDQPRQKFHSPSRAEIDESLKHSATNRLSGRRAEAREDRWQAADGKRATEIVAERTTNRTTTRKHEPSGAWFSRINKSRRVQFD